jgi:NADH:ubiquinone oxidoreductase subunit F (NADH-binding)
VKPAVTKTEQVLLLLAQSGAAHKQHKSATKYAKMAANVTFCAFAEAAAAGLCSVFVNSEVEARRII